MAVQASVKDAFTFVGGLNTEGGYFVTPENSWKEGVNVVPTLDGSIERRNGLDFEANYSISNSGSTWNDLQLNAYSTGIWSTVNGNGNQDFMVVQNGKYITFYDAATGSVSNSKKVFYISLANYAATGNPDSIGIYPCSYASTYGRLIITSANTDPILVEYDPDAQNIVVSVIDIRIRDFKGRQLKSTAGVIYPPEKEWSYAQWNILGISTDDVNYNLYNQGWTDTLIASYTAAYPNLVPANTKSWIHGKDTNDNFSATFLNKQDFGTSPAPKGRVIRSPFNGYAWSIAGTSMSGTDGLYNTTYRPKSCAFFAGRAWFAGLKSQEGLGTVFFSQVLDDINKIGNCYQSNDPTAEVISDLEDDDGGTIEIPEAGEIVSLNPLGRGIMVFATNGVWFISGIDQGFKASSYSVERVSSVGCSSAKSITVVEDSIVYWSSSGIYVLSASNSVEFAAKNISDQAIKTFYSNIPVISKLYVEGSYNATNKTIYWLYSSGEVEDTSNNKVRKDRILVLDLALNAWYWFSLSITPTLVPVSIEITRETSQTSSEFYVTSGTLPDTVIAVSDNVIVDLPIINGTKRVFKILTIASTNPYYYGVTFSDFENTRDSSTKFIDWYTLDNSRTEEPAYFVTGYNLGGNGPARTKSGQYLTVFMKRTETEFDENAIPLNQSGCLMQSRWDFTDNSYPGKWADEVQVYRQQRPYLVFGGEDFDDGYPLVISKNKLRGRGKAVQFKFSAEEGKDMKIVGWTGTFVGSTNV